jgi:hypothetical protein
MRCGGANNNAALSGTSPEIPWQNMWLLVKQE